MPTQFRNENVGRAQSSLTHPIDLTDNLIRWQSESSFFVGVAVVDVGGDDGGSGVGFVISYSSKEIGQETAHAAILLQPKRQALPKDRRRLDVEEEEESSTCCCTDRRRHCMMVWNKGR